MQVTSGEVIARQNQVGLRDCDRAGQRAQGRQTPVRVYAARRVRLLHGMLSRTQHLNPETGVGESRRQTGRGHPIRRRDN